MLGTWGRKEADEAKVDHRCVKGTGVYKKDSNRLALGQSIIDTYFNSQLVLEFKVMFKLSPIYSFFSLQFPN